jgi:hypothetical protein
MRVSLKAPSTIKRNFSLHVLLLAVSWLDVNIWLSQLFYFLLEQVYRPTEEESRRFLDPYENVICIECNQSGENNLMLQCDVCDSSAHTFCVGLGREVPEGNWYCGGCRSSVAGHSYAQTQDRVVDSSSSLFGRSVSSGVPQIPPPLNIRQPSLQEFDLNQSPMETPEEDRRAESHIPTEPVITPTGRHATLDTRRALNRRIRILLSRPRTATNARQNGVENFRDLANAKEQLIPIVKKSIKHISAQSPLGMYSSLSKILFKCINFVSVLVFGL